MVTQRRARGPAVVYLGLTIVLVVLVASLAFTARQPSPPQIAELTPQAQRQITRAPAQLGSAEGSAPGGASAGAAASTTTTSGARPTTAPSGSAAPIDVAAVHHCFGNPPMQIGFDTQSPPCVGYWAGNNGGATAPGVTANTIRVVGYTEANSIGYRVLADLQTFFNRYFEFYGRHLDLIPTGTGGGGSCAASAAEADGVAAADRPFASADPNGAADGCFMAELARDHVVAVSEQGAAWYSDSELAQFQPYLYEYPMAYNREFANIGRFVCTELAGRDASYSPDPIIASQTRKFGLIEMQEQETFQGGVADTSDLKRQLADCGQSLAATDTYYGDGSNSSSAALAPFYSSAILDMKNAQVSTVICLCEIILESGLSTAADSEQYFPEWLLAYGGNDWNLNVKAYWGSADQRKALMGMTFQPKQMPYPQTTLNEALAMVDPGFEVSGSEYVYTGLQMLYWDYLEIAAGIQMAGPDLTAQTFERGLQAARFPNPLSPAEEGAVGFGGGSHSMTTDAAVMWWSDTTPSPYPEEGTGTWCYVDGGDRYSLATWPEGPPQMFHGPCIS